MPPLSCQRWCGSGLRGEIDIGLRMHARHSETAIGVLGTALMFVYSTFALPVVLSSFISLVSASTARSTSFSER